MALEKTLVVRYVGDASGLMRTQSQVESRSAKIGSAIKKIAKVVAVAALALGVVAIKAYEDQEKALTKLHNTLSHNPALARTNIKSWVDLATSISETTAASRTSVEAGIAVLGQFKINAAQMKSVIPLVVDYARKTGRDVPDAAGLIGKALLGNTRALKAIGIAYKATGDPAKDFANISDLVRSKVGGFAEDEGKTASGRLAIMKNQFTNVAAAVGEKLVPILLILLNNMKSMGPVIFGLYLAFKLAFGPAALGPWGLLIAAIVTGVALVIANWKAISRFAKAVWTTVKNTVISIVGDLLGWLVQGWAEWLGFFLHIAGAIVGAAAKAFGWIPFLGSKIKAASANFNKWTTGVLGGLNSAAQKFHSWGDAATSELDRAHAAAVRAAAQFHQLYPSAGSGGSHHYQHGTDFAPGGMAWVGEAGPEQMYIPRGARIVPHRASMRVAPAGGSVTNVTINVHVAGSVRTEQDLVDAIEKGLVLKGRRNGGRILGRM
jgi:hypothetical protein